MSSNGFAGFLARSGGTTLVLLGLGAVAWWGHRTGWKAGRFAEVFGATAAAPAEDWCADHNVPESRCIACHPELVGADAADWCKEHGVPESQCTACHPELLTKGRADDWCREHGVPESQCPQCHPEIAVKSEAPPSAGATVTADPAAPARPDPLACRLHALRVQFASAESVRRAGVRLEAVQERPMAAHVAAPGEVEYDPTRVARLSARAAGTAWRVDAEVGRAVRKGDVLALVDAADVGRAKTDLLLAFAAAEQASALARSRDALAGDGERIAALAQDAVARAKSAAQEGFRTQSDVRDAEARAAEAQVQLSERRSAAGEAAAAVREARLRLLAAEQSLANLGLPLREEDFAGLSEHGLAERVRLLGLPAAAGLDATAGASLLPVLAPLDGVVVSRDVVAGEQVEPGRPLFVVADVSRMWLTLDVSEEEAGRVAPGQSVSFRPDGGREDAVAARVAWVSTESDDRTRTVRVRAEVANEGGRLRAHTFGAGRITVREAPEAVAVPTEAVHWEGCCHVVFVRLTDEVFQTRKVRIGTRDARFTEVLAGVLPGEVVAGAGSHVLKSEILKSRLGAGCCDD